MRFGMNMSNGGPARNPEAAPTTASFVATLWRPRGIKNQRIKGAGHREVAMRHWVLATAVLGFQALACAGTAAAQESAAPAGEYIVGPGDILQVFVWRNPELTSVVPVRPDGKISTPLVEDMVAVGKTPSRLARDIEKVLAEYIRQPQVNIIVSTALSTFSQVKIIGQVANPQAIPYREGMTVLDAVLAVGGLGEYAAGNRAKLVRVEGGSHKETKIRLLDLINKGDLAENLALRPGDVIVVPESRL
ncbi:MAG: XrtA/PEP-CTERM system exopolysaccharide export protein [Steroidobacteraceae bacterium]